MNISEQGKEYRLNLRTKQCNVSTLTRPFRYIGVPPDAKFVFEATIGAAGVAGESLVVETFVGKFNDSCKKYRLFKKDKLNKVRLTERIFLRVYKYNLNYSLKNHVTDMA